MRSALLARVVGSDVQAGIDAITERPDGGTATAEAEHDAPPPEEQARMGAAVLATVRRSIALSARGLRSTAQLLGIDDDLNPEYVAPVAAMLWMGTGPDGRLYDPTDDEADA